MGGFASSEINCQHLNNFLPGKILKADKEPTDGGGGGGGGERLTEREYLAIGICSGFLLMLYIFAMVVFLLIRRRHRRDKRLREQFLNLPLPQGLGYKSSRILGLEDSFNPYFGREVGGGGAAEGMTKGGRLSVRSAGRCSLHARTGQDQIEQIYDITKVLNILILFYSIFNQFSYSKQFSFLFSYVSALVQFSCFMPIFLLQPSFTFCQPILSLHTTFLASIYFFASHQFSCFMSIFLLHPPTYTLSANFIASHHLSCFNLFFCFTPIFLLHVDFLAAPTHLYFFSQFYRFNPIFCCTLIVLLLASI
jgi:hypothetical protein